jgi:Uma2 family endonuclease
MTGVSTVFDDLPHRMSFDAFLDYEDGGDIRHEYLGGAVYAMTGGTRAHNQITGRLFSRILPAADAHGRRTYINDVLLRAGDDAFYPDVMVACKEEVHPRFETSPCLVIEVVSPSTEKYDRTAKHAAYTNIDSVLAYVLVSGDAAEPWVEVHRRAGDLWFRDRLGPTDILKLKCPPMDIPVSEIFGLAV